MGYRDENAVCNSGYSGAFNNSTGGGRIVAHDALFDANGIHISFLRTLSAVSSSSNQIEDCDFTGADLNSVDKRYNSNYTPHYAQGAYPFNVVSNPLGRTHAGIIVRRLKKLNIGNMNASPNARNNFVNNYFGIQSFSSQIGVLNNIINNAYIGVDIQGGISSVNFFNMVRGNEFYNIYPVGNMQGVGVRITAGRFDVIRDNMFGIDSENPSIIRTGIQTDNTSNLYVVDNTFTRYFRGMWLRNTINNQATTGQGYIGKWDSQFGNRFTNCRFGIITGSATTGTIPVHDITIHCNTHSNSGGIYSRNWRNAGDLKDQGAPGAQTDYDNPAGNYFAPPTMKHIVSFSLPNSFSPTYKYYAHGENNINTNPYLPAGIGSVYVSATQIQYMDGESCPEHPDLPEPQLLILKTDIEQRIATLQAEQSGLEATLDNGNTSLLLQAIAGNTPNGSLKNLLLSASPLSDETLTALLEQENSLSPGNFKNVMELNLPVSDDIESNLYEKLFTLPQGICNQLIARQAFNPGATTVTSIQRQIDNLASERELVITGLVRKLIENDEIQTVIDLLEDENTVSADMLLVSTYLQLEETATARQLLATVPVVNAQSQAWIDLISLQLDLAETGKSLYDLDASQKTLVETLANDCDAGLACSNARAIALMLWGEEYPDCYEEFNDDIDPKSLTLNENHEAAGSDEEHIYLGISYPNPASEKTWIPYALPDEGNYLFTIYDMAGKQVFANVPVERKGIFEVSCTDFAPGVYTYSLENDAGIFEKHRMVITK